MNDDVNVSKQYRELGAEEPPRALDEAILAAARREAGARPGALPARRNRQRWFAPLATAAVLVLAVAVTVNMQVERPGIDFPAQRVEEPAAATSAPDAKEELKLKATADLKLAPKPAVEADARSRRKEAAPAATSAAPAIPAAPAPAVREPQPFAANQAPERAASRADDARDSRGPASSVTGEFARQMEGRTSRDAEAAERAPQMGALQSLAKRPERGEAQAKVQAAKPAESPERELERIAELRTQGRHDEADKALVEFRKRYPEFRIPDATRERVERR